MWVKAKTNTDQTSRKKDQNRQKGDEAAGTIIRRLGQVKGEEVAPSRRRRRRKKKKKYEAE